MADNVVNTSGWEDDWEQGKTGFHKVEVHPMLTAHLDKLLNGRKTIKIFFPLCGKAVDMYWLYTQGHCVVGVEVSPVALEQFFSENNLDYVKESVSSVGGTLYKTKDGKIKLYACDFYKFNASLEGQFDAIWDRGSFVAINKADRQKYVNLMLTLMSPGCRYMLETLDYDPNKYAGPPHCVSEEDIYDLYGGVCVITRVDYRDEMEEVDPAWGLDKCFSRWDLLYLKRCEMN